MKRGLLLSILGGVANLILGLVKLFIGIVSNSITIFFDSINNMLDVVGNAAGAVGLRVARRLPNNDYPNGYSKVEYIVALIISLGSLLFGCLFVFYSVERIIFPLPVYFAWLYFGLLFLTVIAKIIMAIVYHFEYKKSHSAIMRSLMLDAIMDACITGCAVICYGVSSRTNTVIDAILGVILGVMILVFTVKSIIGACQGLLDYNDSVDVKNILEDIMDNNIMTHINWVSLTSRGSNMPALVVAGSLGENASALDSLESKYMLHILLLKENINNG